MPDTQILNSLKFCIVFPARLTFLFSLFTGTLNGYFIITSFLYTYNNPHKSSGYQTAAYIVGLCDVILYGKVILSDVLVNFVFLMYDLETEHAVYLETKSLAAGVKSLSTLSLLRYLPSVELVTAYLLKWHERAERWWTWFILFWKKPEGSKKKNYCSRAFFVPMFIIETFAPLLAVFAVLVKIKQLDFLFTVDPWSDWGLWDFVRFFAFLNQVAGLRVLRDIETATIQHFVFSGADATLDTRELLLLDDWWNITLLSAVSNLNLNWFDNTVFWCGMDPQKIQLLLKNHYVPKDYGAQLSILQVAEQSDVILKEYDAKVFDVLRGNVEQDISKGISGRKDIVFVSDFWI